MTKQEFESNLANLLREFEKEGEPVELEFAYFDDELDMVHVWEDEGFVFQKHPNILENQRNTESELDSINAKELDRLKARIKLAEENGDYTILDKKHDFIVKKND